MLMHEEEYGKLVFGPVLKYTFKAFPDKHLGCRVHGPSSECPPWDLGHQAGLWVEISQALGARETHAACWLPCGIRVR